MKYSKLERVLGSTGRKLSDKIARRIKVSERTSRFSNDPRIDRFVIVSFDPANPNLTFKLEVRVRLRYAVALCCSAVVL